MGLQEHEIPKWKIDEVKTLIDTIKKSKMVGLVNVEGVGAKQLHGIRESLRKSARIRMTRNTLMRRAIKDSKMAGFDDIEKYVRGPVAFLFSEADPFTLSKFLSENRTKAPAKGGQVTPKDIIIPAMNTGVAPGPFISELTALKIPARVKGGSIHVTDDTVVVKAGEIVSNAMAQMLARLKIEPMELQLKLIAAYSDGVLLTQKDFEIDLEALFQEVLLGHEYAINLSLNTGFPTKDTIPLIIAKANMEAKSLTLNIGFFEPDMFVEFLAKGNSEAFALAALLASKNPDAVPSEILKQVQTAVQTPAATTTSPEPDKKKDEPEKKEDKEEEVTGIAGLFG